MSDVDSSIYGLPVRPLPDGWMPTDAVTIIKCLAPNGNLAYQYAMRSTSALHLVEAIGMLESTLADLKSDYVGLVNRGTRDGD